MDLILLKAIAAQHPIVGKLPPARLDVIWERYQADLRVALARTGVALDPWLGPPAPVSRPAPDKARPDTAELLPLSDYDHILVGFSAGKDSVVCVLTLWEQLEAIGIDPASKIELWHHCVDGDRSVDPNLFDWPCTESYCDIFAESLGLPLYRSWREGGFLREMQREGNATAPVHFETPEGVLVTGGLGPPGTRKMFPQQSADLSVRWCSAYLKIMVASSAINNDPRFDRNKKILVVTGERRQESAARSRYATVETHRSNAPSKGRIVHQWRPILGWTHGEVYGIMQRWGIVPHPCYWLGFGRASCEVCIFSQAEEWATLHAIHPDRVAEIARLEAWTGKTIHRQRSVPAQVAKGESFAPATVLGRWWAMQATHTDLTVPLRVDPARWVLPPGAFRQGSGPT